MTAERDAAKRNAEQAVPVTVSFKQPQSARACHPKFMTISLRQCCQAMLKLLMGRSLPFADQPQGPSFDHLWKAKLCLARI